MEPSHGERKEKGESNNVFQYNMEFLGSEGVAVLLSTDVCITPDELKYVLGSGTDVAQQNHVFCKQMFSIVNQL